MGQTNGETVRTGPPGPLRPAATGSVLVCPGAADLAASTVPLLSPPPGGGLALTPRAGRNLDVPCPGSTGISGAIAMLTQWLGGQWQELPLLLMNDPHGGQSPSSLTNGP